MQSVSFLLNGKSVTSASDPATRMLDVLRDEFFLTGVKCGCGEGECGACSVLLDGLLINACLLPLGHVEAKHIITIEGFRDTPRFEVLSHAFDVCGAIQCGFCTPGMILAAEALLSSCAHPTAAQIREALSGNFCRCTGYAMIVEAVRYAAEKGEGLW